jgi:hypothetical protein
MLDVEIDQHAGALHTVLGADNDKLVACIAQMHGEDACLLAQESVILRLRSNIHEFASKFDLEPPKGLQRERLGADELK